jgi:hypothetical protein
MKEITIEVKCKATVNVGDIADEFARLNSEEQSIFLQELFDALEHRCKTRAAFETQLWFIAKAIKDYNFKKLEYVFETLDYFLKNGKDGDQ